ncbi:unnamed protein product [Peronospora destructor]|uniref:BZIP domain-containing protein n=1 Tax=Peronospora destructor TaxID=86335 RepID=A0AAV0TAE5_9STRA|nr:unnamed protein product [Peronospora destructor]
MASMSLKFILCEPEKVLADQTHTHQKNKCIGSSLVLKNDLVGGPPAEPNNPSSVACHQAKDGERSSKTAAKLDRRQHARQLQNLRQRRYRERKKSSVSALQSNSDQLQQKNLALEAAILKHFKSQHCYSFQQDAQTDVQLI